MIVEELRKDNRRKGSNGWSRCDRVVIMGVRGLFGNGSNGLCLRIAGDYMDTVVRIVILVATRVGSSDDQGFYL